MLVMHNTKPIDCFDDVSSQRLVIKSVYMRLLRRQKRTGVMTYPCIYQDLPPVHESNIITCNESVVFDRHTPVFTPALQSARQRRQWRPYCTGWAQHWCIIITFSSYEIIVARDLSLRASTVQISNCQSTLVRHRATTRKMRKQRR